MADDVRLSRKDRVLEVTLSRPGKKNALTGAMYRKMTGALHQASTNPEIRVVLFLGEGDAFSAGNDLADFLNDPDGGGPAFEFIRALATFDKPMVAAVQGLAVGVGTTMLFHCDLIYAAPDARFIMPFVDLGLVPEAGASLLAPLRLGHAKAAAMLLLGEPMDATAADAAGLVTAVIPSGDVRDHARVKAQTLAGKPAAALAATRRLMKGADGLLDRIDEEARLFAEALTSNDAKEAFSAFLEKRSPVLRD